MALAQQSTVRRQTSGNNQARILRLLSTRCIRVNPWSLLGFNDVKLLPVCAPPLNASAALVEKLHASLSGGRRAHDKEHLHSGHSH
eukprot:scaffold313381_cov32-Tisochrysis_lutea.AAC.2